MKGTAILFQEDKKVTIIEGIGHEVYQEIKENAASKDCRCKLDDKVIHFGTVSPVLWHDEDVDWDYGY
jgi:hypothetical protein